MKTDSGLDGNSREALEDPRDHTNVDLFHFQSLVLINILEKISMLDIIHFDRDE